MKVLFLSNYFLPEFIGGAETYSYQLALGLVKRGFGLDVVTTRGAGEAAEILYLNGLRIHRLVPRVFCRINSGTGNPLGLYFFNSLFNPLSHILRSYVKRIAPDIIHLQNITLFDTGVLYDLLRGGSVWTIHDYWPICMFGSLYNRKKDMLCIRNCYECLYPRGVRWLGFSQLKERQKRLKKLGKMVDTIISPSEYLKEKLVEFNYVRGNKITVIRNGIDLDKFRATPPSDRKNIVFVGKICREKGCEYLVKAMPLVLKKIPEAKLLIGGFDEGGEQIRLIKLAHSLGLHRSVRFLEMAEDVRRYYREATVVVVPSIWSENCPMVVLEAMSSGRPVVCTRCGGIPEIVDDGINGFLVEPKNPKQIAERVIELLKDPSLAQRMGAQARRKMESQHNLRDHISQIIDIYCSQSGNACMHARKG